VILDKETHRGFLLSLLKNATINGAHIEHAFELLQAIKNAEVEPEGAEKEDKEND